MQRTTLTLLAILLLFSFVNYGQDDEEKGTSVSTLKFQSISFSPLDFYLTNETGGISPKIDITLNKELHLFKLQFTFEYEYAIFLSNPEVSYQFNFLYGRSLSINSWLYYDVFGGIGLFIATEYNDQSFKTRSSTVGIPIQNRLRFQTKGKFGAGLQFQINLNSLKTIYSPGFFIQLKF